MDPSSSSSNSEPFVAPKAPAELASAVSSALTAAQHQGALSSTVLPRIWAHRPELALAQIELHTRFYDSAVLPARLLELVRLRIALVNDCAVCQASRKSDDVSDADIACLTAAETEFSAAERAALDYAATFAEDHRLVDAGIFDELRRHFDEPQIVELAMFAALMVGSGRMAYAFRALERS